MSSESNTEFLPLMSVYRTKSMHDDPMDVDSPEFTAFAEAANRGHEKTVTWFENMIESDSQTPPGAPKKPAPDSRLGQVPTADLDKIRRRLYDW